jgi:hypothetical protein
VSDILLNFTVDLRHGPPPADFRLHNLTDEVTVVTAYFNIGSFPKGAPNAVRFTRELYRQVRNRQLEEQM